MELERAGDLAGAKREADAALAAGGARDAKVQAAKLAILDERYDEAIALLAPLVQEAPKDAGVQYNLALGRHHQGDYNRARAGYLAAVRLDPTFADARYNLAVLCHTHGFLEEAQHHVARFRRDYPEDRRGPTLERLVGVFDTTRAAPVPTVQPDAPQAIPR